MAKAIRAHDLGARVAMVLVAALLLLVTIVFVVQQTATTVDRADSPAIGAGVPGTGENYGQGWNNYGYDAAHAAALRQAAQTGDGADSVIDRHAEVVARYQEGPPR